MIVGILILIVSAYSWFGSSTNETKTFSDGAMSFNYPADFDNVSYSADDNSSSSKKLIGKLYNSAPFKVQTIWVDKNTSAIFPTEARDKLISLIKKYPKGELVSTTSETNPNGVVVEKITHTDEIEQGTRSRYIEMIFKINDTVYGIMIYGDDTKDNQKVMDNTANIIFQSIK
jgi:hypothetical protein